MIESQKFKQECIQEILSQGEDEHFLEMTNKWFKASLSKKYSYHFDFLSFLHEAKRNGKQVVGYGSAAKGNALMNFVGIRQDLISYVVDKNPAKQNMYSPGSKIPVLSEQILQDERPDYIVILPWNLKEEIKDQLNYVTEWGCKFVVAIPELTIL